jgi:hypothetical protein
MKTWSASLIFAAALLIALWGCPSKKIVPDPVPPQPKVGQVQVTESRYLILKGMAPPVGPKVYFLWMLA